MSNTQLTPNRFLHDNRKDITAGAIREYKEGAFLGGLQTVIQDNPALMKAIQTDRGRSQVIGVMVKAGQLGYNLLPGADQEAAIIAYGEGDRLHIEYQIMKNGHIRAALETGKVKSIRSAIVHEKDQFEHIRTTEHGDAIKHSFNIFTPRGPVVGAYAEMKMKDGESFVYVAGIEELEQVKQSSKMFQKKPNASAWSNNFNGMCEKTVIKRVIQKTHLPVNDTLTDWQPPEPTNVTPKGMGADDIPGAIEEAAKPEPRIVTPKKQPTEPPPEKAAEGDGPVLF